MWEGETMWDIFCSFYFQVTERLRDLNREQPVAFVNRVAKKLGQSMWNVLHAETHIASFIAYHLKFRLMNAEQNKKHITLICTAVFARGSIATK